MVYLLYTSAVADSARRQATVRAIMEDPVPGIEIQSHQPEVFYRMGAARDAYNEILALSDENSERRTYPEVSFALVGAVATGLMGIVPGTGDEALRTLPQLPDGTPWAELSDVSVGGAAVDVRHEGNGRSILTNRSSGPIRWTAAFYGAYDRLNADGVPMPADPGADDAGRPISSVTLEVPVGAASAVEVP
jgi:hypothetical protein